MDGDAVVEESRYIPERGQGEDGGNSRIGQGWEGTVTGEKRKTPGMGQHQRIVQRSKTN